MDKDYEMPLNSITTNPKILKTSMATEKAKEERAFLNRLNLKIERKKHMMSLMDTLLTLLIVSPLIVGHWRGTWDLMDIYSNAFPAWESFLFGGSLHLCFTIMRDGLQDLIKFKTNSWPKTILAYSLRRLYTYFFAAACIMNWRGGWIIFDEWLGTEFLPDGRAHVGKNVSLIVGVFVVSLILLGVLRSFRNILAAPFVIALDTKSSAFDFPTRYRQTISYTTLYAVNNNPPIENPNSSGNMSSPSAEKLSLSASPVMIEKQVVEHILPHPFGNDLRGASPSGFSSSFGQTTTSSYPQIPNHKTHTRPNNIQDIIQYLTENAHRQKDLIKEEQNFANSNREREKFKLFGTIQGPRASHTQNQDNHNSGFNFHRARFPQDPFFAYKPQDPSDINLLAPSSFRFAPAILATNIYRNRQKLLQEAADASRNTANEEIKKPFSLTLNIYPSHFQDDLQKENRFRFQGPGLTPRYKYPSLGLQRARIGTKLRKMVVHLNVYPGSEPTNNSPSSDENESRFRLPN